MSKYDLQGLLSIVRDRKISVADDVINREHYKYVCELEEKLEKMIDEKCDKE